MCFVNVKTHHNSTVSKEKDHLPLVINCGIIQYSLNPCSWEYSVDQGSRTRVLENGCDINQWSGVRTGIFQEYFSHPKLPGNKVYENIPRNQES